MPVAGVRLNADVLRRARPRGVAMAATLSSASGEPKSSRLRGYGYVRTASRSCRGLRRSKPEPDPEVRSPLGQRKVFHSPPCPHTSPDLEHRPFARVREPLAGFCRLAGSRRTGPSIDHARDAHGCSSSPTRACRVNKAADDPVIDIGLRLRRSGAAKWPYSVTKAL